MQPAQRRELLYCQEIFTTRSIISVNHVFQDNSADINCKYVHLCGKDYVDLFPI